MKKPVLTSKHGMLAIRFPELKSFFKVLIDANLVRFDSGYVAAMVFLQSSSIKLQ
jgi:hypothetical protein